MQPTDLVPYEIKMFAEVVAATRNNLLPLNEMPSNNTMLKK
jgi:hypothetical protein